MLEEARLVVKDKGPSLKSKEDALKEIRGILARMPAQIRLLTKTTV
jgi:hypothetical protein